MKRPGGSKGIVKESEEKSIAEWRRQTGGSLEMSEEKSAAWSRRDSAAQGVVDVRAWLLSHGICIL